VLKRRVLMERESCKFARVCVCVRERERERERGKFHVKRTTVGINDAVGLARRY
jgi:hypothetical protein